MHTVIVLLILWLVKFLGTCIIIDSLRQLSLMVLQILIRVPQLKMHGL